MVQAGGGRGGGGSSSAHDRRRRRPQQSDATTRPVTGASPVVAAARLSAQFRPLRLALCALIYAALLARCWRLLLARHKLRLAVAAAAAAVACRLLPPLSLPLLLASALAWHARRLPAAANPGHRGGAEGYGGEGSGHCENTIAALRALLRGPRGGEVVSYGAPAAAGEEGKAHGGSIGSISSDAYVEVDVRETADGALVLLHDASLRARAFPYLFERGEGVGGGATLSLSSSLPSSAAVRWPEAVHLAPLELLRSADLGRPGSGARVATLEEVLEELRAWAEARSGGGSGSRRRGASTIVLPRLAVDVKSVHTDAARRQLIALVGSYARDAAAACPAPCRPPSSSSLLLGGDACALIALPWCFEASFGRFGSAEWRRWSDELECEGLAARCVALHTLKLAG